MNETVLLMILYEYLTEIEEKKYILKLLNIKTNVMTDGNYFTSFTRQNLFT